MKALPVLTERSVDIRRRDTAAQPLLESLTTEPNGMGKDMGGGGGRWRRRASFGRDVGDGGRLVRSGSGVVVPNTLGYTA